MKFSSKVKKCGLSPMRKFHPYAVAAEAKGRKIYHLNIGQPDVETPPQFFEAVRNFSQSVLEYAPSPGVPEPPPRRDTATLTGLKSRRRSMSTPAPLSAPTPATPPALC